jgi:hypothetical protein
MMLQVPEDSWKVGDPIAQLSKAVCLAPAILIGELNTQRLNAL